jgi:hypothetical protein
MRSILIITALFLATVLHSQTTLTAGEIFNFNINDEFHTVNDLPQGGSPNAKRMTVIDKHYSAANDTVFYTRSFNNYYSVFNPNPTPHLDYYFDAYTDSVFYTNLNDSVLCTGYDTTCNSIIDTTICGILTNGREYIGLEEYSSIIYGQGLGIVREVSWQNPTLFYDYKIFYFKKDSLECGTPDLMTSISADKISLGIQNIYPNPFTDKINIQFADDQHTYKIKIFNLNGQEIFETTANNCNIVVIDEIKDKGFHLLKIESEDGSFVRKIIKK